MMSGLEINTTFVSYIKTSMYLTGMSREELYAEGPHCNIDPNEHVYR